MQQNGIVDLEELEATIRPDTSLVSIMTVNNETGVIQPIKEIGAIAHKHRGVYFHTDAAQAAGKIQIDVNEMNIDLMSIFVLLLAEVTCLQIELSESVF